MFQLSKEEAKNLQQQISIIERILAPCIYRTRIAMQTNQAL
jgi:hypothetical protein